MTSSTQPRPPLAERLSARTRLFGVLLTAAVVAVFLPLPWRLTGLAFAVATVVVGFRLLAALAQSRRAGGRSTGFIGVSAGLGLAAILIVQLALEAAFYPVVRDREACLAQAPTIQAQQRCTEEFSSRLERFVSPVSGSFLR